MPKAILPLMGLGLLMVFLGAGEAAVPKQALEQQAKSIQGVLPEGWTVKVEPDYSLLWIERKEKAIVINKMPSQPARVAGQGPETGVISMILRVGAPKSEAEVAAIEKQNADREAALKMMRAQMTDMQATVKPSAETESYAARTADQQARLDAFVAVKRAMPRPFVPNLFAKDASLTLEMDEWILPAEESVKKELEGVRKKVEGLYSKKPLN